MAGDLALQINLLSLSLSWLFSWLFCGVHTAKQYNANAVKIHTDEPMVCLLLVMTHRRIPATEPFTFTW